MTANPKPQTAELVPCPFCGGEPRFIVGYWSEGSWRGDYVRCDGCGAVGPRRTLVTEPENREAWNTRLAHAKEQAAGVDAIQRALLAQMEAQEDDTTPSSVQRDKGLIWLEGWFDLKAALAAPASSVTDSLRLVEVLELLAAVGGRATAYGLSPPGEPSWGIEQDRRESARKWLADPSNWLEKVRAALAALRSPDAECIGLAEAARDLLEAQKRDERTVGFRVDLWKCLAANLGEDVA